MVRYRRKLGLGNLRGVQTPAILIAVLLVILMFLMYAGPRFGFTAAMTDTLFMLIPSMFGLIVCAWVAREATNPAFVGGAVMGIGITVCYTLYALYGVGVFTDATFLPGTLEDTMIFCMVIFCFLGAVAGALMRRR